MTSQPKSRSERASEAREHVLRLLHNLQRDEHIRNEHYRAKGIELDPVIDYSLFDFSDPDMDDEPMNEENSKRQFAEWLQRKQERAKRKRKATKNLHDESQE